VGKISEALDKYVSERKSFDPQAQPAAAMLTDDDILALVAYDDKTGHLLKTDPATGQVDERRIEELRAGGTILRLLDNQLIYPGGKLTARGIEEAHRLAAVSAAIPRRPAGHDPGRGRAAQEVERTVEQAISPVLEPEPRLSSSSAPTAALESEETFIKAYDTPQNTQTVESPLLAVPRPLKVAPEPKHVPKIIRGESPPPLWDEAAIDRKLVVLTDPQSPEAEQFKILRTNILFPLTGRPPRSILVTSTAPMEGKTFAAANFAISIALNINRHVLLLDADMRRPQLHQRFGFGHVPGLSNYLAQGQPLPSLLLKTKVDKLTLLPAGPPPDNPAELIGAERMSSLLAEVTNRYPDRIVVIDAPPPAMAAETGVLARQVDGILVVVRFGSTRREDIADLVTRLGSKKILGSIVNYIETASSRYYGYKYAGYGRSSKK
jgi:capsular exopolysaccharide synthesis family protein